MEEYEPLKGLEPEFITDTTETVMSRTHVDYLDESLRKNNPELHLKIHRTTKAIFTEANDRGELELDDSGHIELTTNQFRGFLAMSVIRGAMVALVNTTLPEKDSFN